MVFLILFSILISILFLKIKIEINDFYFSLEKKEHVSKESKAFIKIFILNCIPIAKIKINKKQIKKLNVKNRIRKLKFKLDKNFFEIIKYIKPKIKKLDLYIEIGTENAETTAYICGALSVLLYNSFKKNVHIQTFFNNKNQLNIKLDSILEISLIEIIKRVIKHNKGYINANFRAYYYKHKFYKESEEK